MHKIVSSIAIFNERIGKFFSWFTFLLVLLIFADVVMRYLFNFTLIWVVELETYFFALIFMMGGGYTLLHQKHVRVDLFYSNFSAKRKAWVNLFGGLFFLLPWAAISAYASWGYFFSSFQLGERSPQPGGLPALYLLKFILFAGFALLILQAIATILDSLLTIFDKSAQEIRTKIDSSQTDGTWEL